MKNPPLRYVLAMMRFHTNLNLEKHIPAFQEKVWHAYPQLSDETIQGIQISVGPKGAESHQVSNKTWQFASEDQKFALILAPDFLLLHAGSDYDGHEDFIGRFRRAVEALVSVNALAKNMTALGYRYVDLIEPTEATNDTLSAYLKPWVMPSNDFESRDGIGFINSASFMAFGTPQGILRFQALRRPPAALPPELITPFVQKNRWLGTRPSGDFALLDLDHGVAFPEPPIIVPDDVADRLLGMRKPILDLFHDAITPHAEQVWNSDHVR